MVKTNRFPIALQAYDPRIRFRPVRLTDVGQLYRRCLPRTTEEDVEDMIHRAWQIKEQGRGGGYVVLGDDWRVIQGYGQFTIWSGSAEISDLIVAESERSKGFGTALIQYLCRTVQAMPIDTIEIGVALSNPRALALYRRLGFKDDRTIELNLGDGDEPVMYLRLPLK